MNISGLRRGSFCAVALLGISISSHAQNQMERLSRGVVAVRANSSQVYVGWRLFGTEAPNTAFNLYRSTNGGQATLLNGSPITGSTNFIDTSAPPSQSNRYFVRTVVDGVEQADSASFTMPANTPVRQYLEIPLQVPAGGNVNGSSYTYSPGDVSVGDLDGDGELEYVVKWDPSNQQDNANDGFTGPVILDGYELNGTRLWRINLGRNIRAGAHYTQYSVFDLDGDGDAEVALKTADGTVSGTGQVIGNANADYRTTTGRVGRILSGPEFYTVFNGRDGSILDTAPFEPARGNISQYGDNWGNRGDRMGAAVAYLDGQRPSVITARGVYERTKIAAWDFRNGELTMRWLFDSNGNGAWEGKGSHGISVADVDGNGTQEIVYGAMTINANGTPRNSTSHYGHGDALHVGDLVPSRPGLEIWMIYESATTAASLRDANTGAVIMSKANNTGEEGPARGVGADIYAGNPGAEFWCAGPCPSGLFSASGANVGRTPGSQNFLAWWDADPVRELLDQNRVDKYGTGGDTRLLTADGASSINGTKATPNLSGDILGDWREEIILRANNNASLRIYTTTTVANSRIYTLLHDPQYRVALAWQNTAYNQPPHPGFFIGANMPTPPRPNIVLVGDDTQEPPPGVVQAETASVGGGTVLETTHGGFNGSGYVNFSASGGFADLNGVDGEGGGLKTLRIRFALGATAARIGQLMVNGVASNITFPPTGAWTTWQNQDVTVSLNDGTANTIRFLSDGQDLANIDEIEVLGDGNPQPPSVVQAESALIGGGTVLESTNGGFAGSGYVNMPASGGFAELSGVDGEGGGQKTLRVRFALGAASARTGQLVVNGTTTNVTFQPTGAWTNWQNQNVSVNLNAGIGNTIRFQTNGQDLANIDEIEVL
jgi:rhamnogalacturonan endolyase